MIGQKPSKIIALYDEDFSNIVTGLIERAKKNIYLTTYKLEPRKGPKAQRINALIKQLFLAGSRGVDIKIMLNFLREPQSYIKYKLVCCKNVSKEWHNSKISNHRQDFTSKAFFN